MSWYSSSWKYRVPITVYCDAASGTFDWTAAIPGTMSHLFSNALASGNDLRVMDADGVTPITYDLNTFSTTNFTGTIEADNDPLIGAASAPQPMNLKWLYYGNSGAADGRTVFAPAAAKTGTFSMDLPGTYVLRAGPEQPGATKPAFRVAKKSTESIDVYIDVTDVLIKRADPSQGSQLFEEVDYMSVTGRTTNATDNTVVQAASHRFLTTPDGRFYAVVRLIAGAAGTDYTVIASITTTLSPVARVLDYRIWLQVRDVDED